MIRHIEGWDLSSFEASGLSYVINAGIFVQGVIITGQSQGQSWWVFNTGFGEADYTRILDAQPVWTLNIWFRPQVTATGTQTQTWIDAVWYQIADATGVLFDLHQHTDGTMDFRGSTGEILATFGPNPVGTWAALQIKVQSTGFVIRLNGVQIAAGTVNVWRQPDRFTHRWQGGAGFNLDNYVLVDGQGAQNTGFLPYPWAVASRYPAVATTSQWTPNGYANALTCVFDHQGVPTPSEYPDGESGYIKPTVTGQRALFEMQDFTCQGRILGVALSVVAKPLSGGQSMKLIVEETAIHTLAEPTLAGRSVQLPGLPDLDDYVTYFGIAETDPETGTFWNDGDLGRYGWGVEADTTDVHVTQIFLQKVVTLASLPYSCGGAGNYGF